MAGQFGGFEPALPARRWCRNAGKHPHARPHRDERGNPAIASTGASKSSTAMASVEGRMKMTPATTLGEPAADPRDMSAAHTMFRREFGLMPGLVRAVTPGDTQRARLVADHIALLSGVLSQYHAGQDRYIWPRLRERCPEESGPLVDVMEGEHHAVRTRLLQVSKAMQPWRDRASARARGALAGAIDQLIAVITEHLALEQERVGPLIVKHITDAEYAVLAQERAAHIPPGKLTAVLGMIMYHGDPAASDMILSQMPVEVRQRHARRPGAALAVAGRRRGLPPLG
jgi:hemerythrin-like domain-containing protein